MRFDVSQADQPAQSKTTSAMTKNDHALIRPCDIALATALLTRVPVSVNDRTRGAQAAWAYPVVGLLPGGLAALLGLFAVSIGLPVVIGALVALASGVIVTGALHEDGLADTVDGFWGGWDRDKRLAIMKDSHIGTYGVLALLFSFALRWAALFVILQSEHAVAAILSAAILSRSVMPALMATLPHARETGLSHSVGHVSVATAAVATGLGAVVSFMLLGTDALAPLLLVTLVTYAVGTIARAKIGGQTGDVLGAGQQVSEITVLIVLAA